MWLFPQNEWVHAAMLGTACSCSLVMRLHEGRLKLLLLLLLLLLQLMPVTCHMRLGPDIWLHVGYASQHA